MHWNRQAPGGTAFTPAEIARFEDTVAWRHRTQLRYRAAAAHRRLLNSARDYATLNPTLNDVVDPFVTMFRKIRPPCRCPRFSLIGAAYCPVFICDRLTASWLGNVRAGFGFGAPVVFAGNGANFVDELRRAWQSAGPAIGAG
jgi:hypothetical protein